MDAIYIFNGQSTTDHAITGTVTIKMNPETSQGVVFDIVEFSLHCDGETYAGTGGNLRFLGGPNPETVVAFAGAGWVMGEWNNDNTGAGFENIDGSRYLEPQPGFGLKAMYEHLSPRITMCSHQITGGPFQPKDWVELTWAPKKSGAPGAPGIPNIT